MVRIFLKTDYSITNVVFPNSMGDGVLVRELEDECLWLMYEIHDDWFVFNHYCLFKL